MMPATENPRNRLMNPYAETYGSDGYSNNSLSLERGYQRDETPDSDSDTVYTELLRGSVPCPTCRGIGNVPKEQEGQLIALIPLKDERLKPRRTKLWVSLAIFMCILTAGLLVFFMFPRTVNIESVKPYLQPIGPVYINVSEKMVTFTIMNSVNVSNQNYFSIKVTNMKLNVMYDTQVIAVAFNSTMLDVSMRSKRQYEIEVKVSLNKHNEMGYMVDSCRNPIRWAHEMVMLFDFTCNYEYFGHSEQTTLQTFQFVSCYSDVKPTTTTTTTTHPPKTTTTTKIPPKSVATVNF